MNRLNSFPPRSRQQGISLLVAMIFLIVLSLLGIVSIRGVVMQERMAGNAQDWDLAFQAAEAGLRDGEADVATARVLNGNFSSCDSGTYGSGIGVGLCAPSTGAPFWTYMKDHDGCWAGTSPSSSCGSDTVSVVYGSQSGASKLAVSSSGGASTDLARQPRYVIEDLGTVGAGSLVTRSYGSAPPPHAYRITAVGFGNIQNTGNGAATRVILQSTYVIGL